MRLKDRFNRYFFKSIILGDDPGYYHSYAHARRCEGRWAVFRRWFAFRVGHLPNRYRPDPEYQTEANWRKNLGQKEGA